ncbi:MAG: gliding motility-associated C-terminal domain-containing protein [Bacteroidia bacterium]|nr:gliding motility-associated C-terminal domain-containing protein [Bacteroidia bacterium]
MTGGTDPWGNFPRVFPGGNYSIKIGDDWANTCYCNNLGICNSFARRQINVTPANNLLQLHFAFVVYNFPHTPADAANIQLRIRDPLTNTYFNCPQFNLYYNGTTNQFVGLNGMFTVNFGGLDTRCETGCFGQCNVSYLPWSTINIDLNSFMGQTIEVEVICNWCAYLVDWAYAYLDMDCLSYNVSNGTCGSTLCAPNGFASYNWTFPNGATQTGSCIVPPVAGIYTVVAQPMIGCQNPTTFTLQVQANFTANVTSSSVTCNGFSNGSASVSVNPPSSNLNYTWLPIGANTPSVSGLSAGVYTVSVSDASCVDTKTFQVLQPPALSITASSQSVSCAGYSNGSASATVAGGMGSYSYTWAPMGGNNSSANNLPANIYTISASDLNGCLISTVIPVIEPSAVLLNSTPNQTICYGNSINLSANASGGTPGYTYNWSNPITANTSGPHSVTLTNSAVFTVQATDQNNCSSPVNTINIHVLPPLIASGYVTSVCDGSMVTLVPNIISPGNGGPYTYTWNNGNTGPQYSVIGNLSNGPQNIFSVSIEDGCSIPGTSAFFTVNVNPNPVISFSAFPKSGCVPLTVYYYGFSNGQNDSFFWNFDNGVTSNQQNFVTTYSNVGSYTPTLTVTSDKGCTTSSFAPNYINVYPYPVADFNASSWTISILDPTVQLFNTSLGASSFSWSVYGGNTYQSNLTNPIFYLDLVGTHTVVLEVKNVYGCYDFIHKLIHVEPEFHIYIPNTFTPNDDNINDVFFPKGIGISETGYKMLIFNRWGELIFESRDFKKGWDGTGRDGEKVKQDVYVYKIYVKDLKGKEHEFTGHVNCIR